MNVAIIDYGSGNLHSAKKAFERAAADMDGDVRIILTSSADEVSKADRIVLPGVGAFADCKAGLLACEGMMDALNESVMNKSRPFLGICVGMQLMAQRGLEHQITDGFGWIEGDVSPITPQDPSLKIPHMGWNTIECTNDHVLLEGIPTGPTGLHAYFVHSFHLQASDPKDIVAQAQYGGDVTAMIAKGNMAGTQFHPEKSQALGLRLIANFLGWTP